MYAPLGAWLARPGGFFFNDTATTEIYTLSLHDALPILSRLVNLEMLSEYSDVIEPARLRQDRKSTRLNSSHANISYAVFCLKKKNPVAARRPRRRRCSAGASVFPAFAIGYTGDNTGPAPSDAGNRAAPACAARFFF